MSPRPAASAADGMRVAHSADAGDWTAQIETRSLMRARSPAGEIAVFAHAREDDAGAALLTVVGDRLKELVDGLPCAIATAARCQREATVAQYHARVRGHDVHRAALEAHPIGRITYLEALVARADQRSSHASTDCDSAAATTLIVLHSSDAAERGRAASDCPPNRQRRRHTRAASANDVAKRAVGLRAPFPSSAVTLAARIGHVLILRQPNDPTRSAAPMRVHASRCRSRTRTLPPLAAAARRAIARPKANPRTVGGPLGVWAEELLCRRPAGERTAFVLDLEEDAISDDAGRERDASMRA